MASRVATALLCAGLLACTSGASVPPAGEAAPATASSDESAAGEPAAPVPQADPATDGRPAPEAPALVRPGPPIVILMIGDGMGYGQLDTASLYRHGRTGALAMQQLPVVGTNRSGSLSGVTDSAASATTLATGVPTYNGRLGLGPHGDVLPTLFDLATEAGLATAIVTTSHVAHATPAAFAVHHPARFEYPHIATQLAENRQPNLLFGGGRTYLGGPPNPRALADAVAEGHRDSMRARGDTLLYTKQQLGAWAYAPSEHRTVGLFADSHLAYVADSPGPEEPSITEMSLRALEVFEQGNRGGIAMIEGARIDHAGHDNALLHSIEETLAFDDAIAAVVAWAADRPNVTILITADHETGGLELRTPGPAGTLPTVHWRTGNHSNDDVPVFAQGPCSARLDGALTSHASLYHTMRACLTGTPLPDPTERARILDGHVDDLEVPLAEGSGVLTALRGASDPVGLWFGVEAALADDDAGVLALVRFSPRATRDALAFGLGDDPVSVAIEALAIDEAGSEGWDLAHWIPGERVRSYDPYAEDTGGRAKGAPGAVLWMANVSSPAVGRGSHAAGGGVEWLLPWQALGQSLPLDEPLRLDVAVARVSADGAPIEWLRPTDGRGIVVDVNGEGMALSDTNSP
jgi:alkaline phosphatase